MEMSPPTSSDEKKPEPGNGPPPGVMVFLGVSAGTIISAVVWPWVWHLDQTRGQWIVWSAVLLPFAKLILFAFGYSSDGGKPFAMGILISIPIGALIFLGICGSQIHL
jgi:hypothetical protein